MSCAFCAIVEGASAEVVWESPRVLGFLDRAPLFPGHVLVIPRAHVPTMSELDSQTSAALFAAAQRVAAAMPAALGCGGTFVAINNVISQSVPHLHVHVVPRSKGDGLRGFFWPRHRYSDGEASLIAEALRRVLS
jgi:histidine triad (HIT) family protein